MTAGLEPGKPNPSAGAATCLGVRPVAKRHHKVGDARGIDLLGGTPPPGRDLVLGLVPRPAKRVEVPRQRRDGRVGLAGVQVGLDLGKRPVVGEPPPTEALRDLSGCSGVVVDLEAEAADNPALGDLKTLAGAHQRPRRHCQAPCWRDRAASHRSPRAGHGYGRPTALPSSAEAGERVHQVVAGLPPGSATTSLRPCGSWRYLNRSRMPTSKPRLCDTTGTSVLRAYHGGSSGSARSAAPTETTPDAWLS
jgi:hypothetical protein